IIVFELEGLMFVQIFFSTSLIALSIAKCSLSEFPHSWSLRFKISRIASSETQRCCDSNSKIA
ncbi:hypothetical protein ACJBY5_10390, partial [Streptococcus suis]